MKLTQLHYKNYRLLINSVLNVDEAMTIIVGRNNTGKTSCMDFLYKVLNGKGISYNDYPLCLRSKLIKLIASYLRGEIYYIDLLKDIDYPSITFCIDYSLEKDDVSLGSLSPFIIEVIDEISIAKIRAIYSLKFEEDKFKQMFEDSIINEIDLVKINEEVLKDILSKNFSKIFALNINALNPSNEKDIQIKSKDELSELFPIYTIYAERYLDESNDKKESSLKQIVSKYFSLDLEAFSPELQEQIKKLRITVENANKQVKDVSDNLLSNLVDKAIGFGYPNGEELELGVQTGIDVVNQIQNSAELTYKSSGFNENLPSSHNGLGYKNLLKIEFELAQFAEEVKQKNLISIPILFIEEPESHMHPQLQQSFASYLRCFLQKLTDVKIQVFITSHSGHMANTVDFSRIRYAQKNTQGVIYKDLGEFASNDEKNAAFIKKYLTLSRCDLFFADKAILVEGASERLLLPDMINKCARENLFISEKYSLPFQYYSIIEIGGAYAYIFIPFMEFLGIPCLILTDLDPALDGRTKSTIKNGKTSFNATIKWWMRTINGLKKDVFVDLNQIIALDSSKKTIRKCHIEYQTEEKGLIGRSLEESIKNVNRDIYNLPSNINEEDLEFNDKSKTEFALDLISKNENYNVPQYIKNGLVWLNGQTVLT